MKGKLILILLTVGLLGVSCKNRKPNGSGSDAISIQVYYTEQYCGGAEPPPELMEKMMETRPYGNQTVYISVFDKPMKVSNEVEVKLDKAGIGEVALDTGVEYVVSFYKLSDPEPPAAEGGKKAPKETEPGGAPEVEEPTNQELCEKQWKHMTAFPLKLKGGSKSYVLNMNKECNPCLPAKP
ncbi:MAG: hypothetical protein JJ975_10300 [Bacteroidia bacterium]|nr:hypothetical protein [Bacteroidia bacterium]